MLNRDIILYIYLSIIFSGFEFDKKEWAELLLTC